MNNKNHEDLQSRREFFRNAAKATLPILVLAVGATPLLSSCDGPMSGCGNSCSGSCDRGCSGSCDSGCTDACWAACKNSCASQYNR